MVHKDYELGSSSRIDALRMKNLNSNRNLELKGFSEVFTTMMGVILPSIYFWRKFNAYSFKSRLAGTCVLALGLGKIISRLALNNFGNLDQSSANEHFIREIKLVDLEKSLKESEEFKLKAMNNVIENK